MKNLAKPVIEFGPVVVFFYFFIKTGEIQSAILPLMVAAGVAIVASLLIEKKVNQYIVILIGLIIIIFAILSFFKNDI